MLQGLGRIPACGAANQHLDGVKSSPNSVTSIMPTNTAVPMAWRISAPTPVASANGKTPTTKEIEVIRLGRNRSRRTSSAAFINH